MYVCACDIEKWDENLQISVHNVTMWPPYYEEHDGAQGLELLYIKHLRILIIRFFGKNDRLLTQSFERTKLAKRQITSLN
jgi:hypothetical protein